MAIRPKSKYSQADEIEIQKISQKSRAVAERMEALRQIAEASKTPLIEEEETYGPNTLPPLEGFTKVRQQQKIHVAVSNNRTHNLKRELQKNTLLLVLLVAAISISCFWALKLLNQL